MFFNSVPKLDDIISVDVIVGVLVFAFDVPATPLTAISTPAAPHDIPTVYLVPAAKVVVWVAW